MASKIGFQNHECMENKIPQQVRDRVFCELNMGTREYMHILNSLEGSFLYSVDDTNFIVKSINKINNEAIESRFSAWQNDVMMSGGEGIDTDEHFCFTCEVSADAIALFGPATKSEGKHILGNRNFGVYVFRHADLALKQAEDEGKTDVKLVVYKFVYGRAKEVILNHGFSNDPNYHSPSAAYTCHVSTITPSKDIQLVVNMDHDQVYLFDVVNNQPLRYPRQIMPYAVIELQHKSQVIVSAQPLFAKTADSKKFMLPGPNFSLTKRNSHPDFAYFRLPLKDNARRFQKLVEEIQMKRIMLSERFEGESTEIENDEIGEYDLKATFTVSSETRVVTLEDRSNDENIESLNQNIENVEENTYETIKSRNHELESLATNITDTDQMKDERDEDHETPQLETKETEQDEEKIQTETDENMNAVAVVLKHENEEEKAQTKPAKLITRPDNKCGKTPSKIKPITNNSGKTDKTPDVIHTEAEKENETVSERQEGLESEQKKTVDEKVKLGSKGGQKETVDEKMKHGSKGGQNSMEDKRQRATPSKCLDNIDKSKVKREPEISSKTTPQKTLNKDFGQALQPSDSHTMKEQSDKNTQSCDRREIGEDVIASKSGPLSPVMQHDVSIASYDGGADWLTVDSVHDTSSSMVEDAVNTETPVKPLLLKIEAIKSPDKTKIVEPTETKTIDSDKDAEAKPEQTQLISEQEIKDKFRAKIVPKPAKDRKSVIDLTEDDNGSDCIVIDDRESPVTIEDLNPGSQAQPKVVELASKKPKDEPSEKEKHTPTKVAQLEEESFSRDKLSVCSMDVDDTRSSTEFSRMSHDEQPIPESTLEQPPRIHVIAPQPLSALGPYVDQPFARFAAQSSNVQPERTISVTAPLYVNTTAPFVITPVQSPVVPQPRYPSPIIRQPFTSPAIRYFQPSPNIYAPNIAMFTPPMPIVSPSQPAIPPSNETSPGTPISENLNFHFPVAEGNGNRSPIVIRPASPPQIPRNLNPDTGLLAIGAQQMSNMLAETLTEHAKGGDSVSVDRLKEISELVVNLTKAAEGGNDCEAPGVSADIPTDPSNPEQLLDFAVKGLDSIIKNLQTMQSSTRVETEQTVTGTNRDTSTIVESDATKKLEEQNCATSTQKNQPTTTPEIQPCEDKGVKQVKPTFYGRTLLVGKSIPPRRIPMNPLYVEHPVKPSGNPEVKPQDPRTHSYKMRRVLESKNVDLLIPDVAESISKASVDSKLESDSIKASVEVKTPQFAVSRGFSPTTPEYLPPGISPTFPCSSPASECVTRTPQSNEDSTGAHDMLEALYEKSKHKTTNPKSGKGATKNKANRSKNNASPNKVRKLESNEIASESSNDAHDLLDEHYDRQKSAEKKKGSLQVSVSFTREGDDKDEAVDKRRIILPQSKQLSKTAKSLASERDGYESCSSLEDGEILSPVRRPKCTDFQSTSNKRFNIIHTQTGVVIQREKIEDKSKKKRKHKSGAKQTKSASASPTFVQGQGHSKAGLKIPSLKSSGMLPQLAKKILNQKQKKDFIAPVRPPKSPQRTISLSDLVESKRKWSHSPSSVSSKSRSPSSVRSFGRRSPSPVHHGDSRGKAKSPSPVRSARYRSPTSPSFSSRRVVRSPSPLYTNRRTPSPVYSRRTRNPSPGHPRRPRSPSPARSVRHRSPTSPVTHARVRRRSPSPHGGHRGHRSRSPHQRKPSYDSYSCRSSRRSDSPCRKSRWDRSPPYRNRSPSAFSVHSETSRSPPYVPPHSEMRYRTSRWDKSPSYRGRSPSGFSVHSETSRSPLRIVKRSNSDHREITTGGGQDARHDTAFINERRSSQSSASVWSTSARLHECNPSTIPLPPEPAPSRDVIQYDGLFGDSPKTNSTSRMTIK